MDTTSQLTRLGLFDARVPRYTSYPTAPQFAGGVGPSEFETWIRAIRPGSEISLYVHVPFCRRLCWFCACRTQGTSSLAPVDVYLETLKREIAHLAKVLPKGVRLGRLHWGGGTPTLLSPVAIRALAGAIFKAVPLAEGGEFSVEIDPNELDEARLDALAEVGMNRASIGVQDFDPEIQQAIGREQSFEITMAAVKGLRARGIKSLNADILFGLPHQTPARIAQSVQKLLALSPDRVALFGYAHVPWMSRRQQLIPSDSLPTPQGRLELFDVARRLFMADGFDEIGIDHFARPEDGLAVAQREGRLRRNFQGYSDEASEVLIGLGASSISRFPQGYAQNIASTGDYTKAVRAGQFATHRGHVFSAEDLWRSRIIEALMCDFAVEKAELAETFGLSAAQQEAIFAPVRARFGDMVGNAPERFIITPQGRPLARIIAREFDAYHLGEARHSSAI